MRVIASVQSKRGSSRGLIHYLAHSKIDPDRESVSGRELFNAFTEHLTVRSANNFLQSECGKGRPSNDGLHHLVLSFRQADFLQIGSTDEERKLRLKIVTRHAIGQLEERLQSERLAWAGAVHLNTANPHVHVAIQKQYLTRDVQSKSLNKIPREALPHFELIEGEKQIVNGILIDSAKVKLLELVEEGSRSREQSKSKRKDHNPRTHEGDKVHIIDAKDAYDDERQILRRGILAEYQLRFREERIAFLIEHRDRLKFPVTDPVQRKRHRVSLVELQHPSNSFDDSQKTAGQQRQIKAIAHNILAKEESDFFNLKEESADTRKNANKIRKHYKKSGIELPTPAFQKGELDDLQKQCLAGSHVREYLFLEQIRSELEISKEIAPRNRDDLERLAGQKILSEMRQRLHQKQISDFKDNRYYRKVPVGKERLSLAMMDRQFDQKASSARSLLRPLRLAIDSIAGSFKKSASKTDDVHLRDAIEKELNEQSSHLQKQLRNDQKKTGALDRVLERNADRRDLNPKFSAEDLIESEALARKLKLTPEYTSFWGLQKGSIVEAQRGQIGTYTGNSESRLVAGRVMAREVLCNIGLNKAKDDLAYFRKSRRFHKFALEDKKNGSTNYLSLNDVDLPRRTSVLDHALNLLLESKDHRILRSDIEARVKEHEVSLKADVAASKGLSIAAAVEAAEFKQHSFWGNAAAPDFQPIFTRSEIAEIEKRIENTSDSKESRKLSSILEDSAKKHSETFDELLNRVFTPELELQTVVHHSSGAPGKRSPSDERERSNSQKIGIGLER
ncbi:MAG TPA: relaxase MobL [Pyrinomonadaceae bacterium]|nr:relaxase MobL [Pyrinomonadaceae bacterium]